MSAPANDAFAAATVLGPFGTVSGTNVDATKEVGEPDHAGNAGGSSVWFAWTAPRDMTVTFSLVAHRHPSIEYDPAVLYDTLLGVYTGTSVDALAEVAANDDAVFNESEVTFAATTGTLYRIAVDGIGGTQGTFVLRWGERGGHWSDWTDHDPWPFTAYDTAAWGDSNTAGDVVSIPSDGDPWHRSDWPEFWTEVFERTWPTGSFPGGSGTQVDRYFDTGIDAVQPALGATLDAQRIDLGGGVENNAFSARGVESYALFDFDYARTYRDDFPDPFWTMAPGSFAPIPGTSDFVEYESDADNERLADGELALWRWPGTGSATGGAGNFSVYFLADAALAPIAYVPVPPPPEAGGLLAQFTVEGDDLTLDGSIGTAEASEVYPGLDAHLSDTWVLGLFFTSDHTLTAPGSDSDADLDLATSLSFGFRVTLNFGLPRYRYWIPDWLDVPVVAPGWYVGHPIGA